MHELGICDALVEAAVRRAAGRRVSVVRARLTGHPVDPEVIDQGFRLSAAGTAVEGARIELAVRPPEARCRDCGQTGSASLIACTRCGGVDVELADGPEIVLESIAFEAPATAAPEQPPGGPAT